MIYQLQDDVPIPRVRNPTYPFAEMAIGQSFFSRARQQSVGSAAAQHSKRHSRGCKFTCRTVTEDGVRGTRCWRIA